jgi:hypothetical protein
MAKASQQICWSVSLIRSRSEQLGVIEAPDKDAALLKAAEEFAIPPDRRDRIVVTKLRKKR